MDNYIAILPIKAVAMLWGDYVRITYGNLNEASNSSGYLVEYPDGYQTWLPKGVFEQCYKWIY